MSQKRPLEEGPSGAKEREVLRGKDSWLLL